MVDADAADWLDQWVQAWGDKMTHLAYTLTADRTLAQDVAQEAFLRLYRYHQDHPEVEIAAGWLYTVTRNLARDALRQRRRRRDHMTEKLEYGVQDSFEHTSTHRLMVQQVLQTLPKTDQECLSLFYFADYSVEQIAWRLHLTPTAVRTRLHRARRRFADHWGGLHDEQP